MPVQPGRGRDFFGGDLDGVAEHLEDLTPWASPRCT